MRVVTIEQLKAIFENLPNNPRVAASGNFATPKTLLAAFDASVSEFRLNMLNAQPGIPDRDGVVYESSFVGAGMRRSPRLEYIPSRLSLLPELLRDHYIPDVVLLHTSVRRHDTVSLGTEVNVLPAAIETARARGGLVVAQANSQMPYTYGDAQIFEHEIDFLIEVDEPLTEKPHGEVGDVPREIASRISAQIENGSTLQLGIGGIPDAVIELMQDRKDLRIWTEMFSDGVLGLEQQGALDADIPITASFVFGSRELYDWMHLNRSIRMMRTETTNDPGLIARQAKMTSINAALEVDLFDQANASYVRGEIYSGFGGSTDFIVGAMHARDGRSFMALPSWHEKAQKSTIVDQLAEHVTSFQHSFVVTEQGVAQCFGRSQSEQAWNLINHAAHPNARDWLTESAKAKRLI